LHTFSFLQKHLAELINLIWLRPSKLPKNYFELSLLLPIVSMKNHSKIKKELISETPHFKY